MSRPVRAVRPRTPVLALVTGTVIALAGWGGSASAARPAPSAPPAPARAAGGTELTETTRLADRRFVVTGTRAYEVGAADGRYPATGWHIRGEMGGFWTPPIKLLDGLWFAVDGRWLAATSFTSGQGYVRMDMAAGDTRVRRVDVVPDGGRTTLIGLTFPGDRQHRRVSLTVDAHSELLSAYPWGWTVPSQAEFNLPDTGSFDGRNLVFRERGTPPVPGAPAHDWAALVGSTMAPVSHALGPDHRGPQRPAVICGDPEPARCDDGPYGRGTGGRLQYRLDIPAGGRTVWFAVAGSDRGLGDAAGELRRALADPAGKAAAKVASRRAVAANTRVDLPGDPLLARSVEWSKQNLADSVQQARDLRVFATHEGKVYPAPGDPVPTVDKIGWIGAGWPDYPWLFATDGEYSAFAAVAAGQFEPVRAHLRALRDVSLAVNGNTGKVVHEVTPDGQVYFGANEDPGNTDETVKFPSAVALLWRWTGDNAFRDEMYPFTKRTMEYALGTMDSDGDGWPEGLGNVERQGMGEEKLDVAVYTIRGLLDLADMAASKGLTADAAWAGGRARQLLAAFEDDWWYAAGGANSYADSLKNPDNTAVFQRHWTGTTPMDALLPGRTDRALADPAHAHAALAQRERDCYTGEFGLFHTGTGPSTQGNPGPSCDSVVSEVGSERATFSLNTAVMAVAEGNYGRLAQQRRYTTGNARIQLDPQVWEMPGAMPEVAPSPDFPANIGRDFLSRSSVLQAWGAYGILWPVVRQHLGVDPDLGHGRLAVVPQIPPGQDRIAGRDIRLGSGHRQGAVAVTATRSGSGIAVRVDTGLPLRLTVGTVLPAHATVRGVLLDGHPVRYRTAVSTRGTEILVDTRGGSHTLTVRLG